MWAPPPWDPHGSLSTAEISTAEDLVLFFCLVKLPLFHLVCLIISTISNNIVLQPKGSSHKNNSLFHSIHFETKQKFGRLLVHCIPLLNTLAIYINGTFCIAILAKILCAPVSLIFFTKFIISGVIIFVPLILT